MSTTKSIGLARLKKLAEFLPKVPAKNFSMRYWCNSTRLSLRKPECGTSACAAGWATFLFKRSGLRLENQGEINTLTYEGRSSWGALEEFFQIGGATSNSLFSLGCNPHATPRSVAKKIKAYLKNEKHTR